jgi:membrane associated rhomboid family serine protease
MDHASEGLRADGSPTPPADFDFLDAPLDRGHAIALLRRADELMDESEPGQALALYGRAAHLPDRDLAAAGTYGMGNALYRLDRDDEALQAWERVTTMGETPATYRAWRQVAAARVRAKDLTGALDAYRQCERRAPARDRAEIHSRLGWLSKETGDTRAAGRYFARSRGDTLPPFMTYLTIGVTVVTSLVAMQNQHLAPGAYNPGGPLELQLQLDKVAVAHGELYRLLSVVLVHDPTNPLPLHLLFNMYALWFAGQLVERMYGPWLTLFFYVVAGISGSIASYAFGDAQYAVGASGAVFGLFGIVLVATRYHLAVLDYQARAVASQVGVLIALNLFLGLSGVLGNVDNFAHLGGLAAGAWLAILLPPGKVPTLFSFWHNKRGGEPSPMGRFVPMALGMVALAGMLVAGYSYGTSKWDQVPHQQGASEPAPVVVTGLPMPAEGYDLELT